MILKKMIGGVLCGAVLVSTIGVSASAAETDTVSGTCSGVGVVGSALIREHTATATTSHMGSGTEGTVKVNCTNEYRDVSAGVTKTATGSGTGKNHVTKEFNVYEEDYMKSLKTTHSVSVRTGTWSDKTSVTYTKR